MDDLLISKLINEIALSVDNLDEIFIASCLASAIECAVALAEAVAVFVKCNCVLSCLT
jgi:hypothetical protein